MIKLLHIETSGKNCSVAISIGNEIVAQRLVSAENFVHAEQLHVLMAEVQQESGIHWQHLSAVAVSKGPGSYTGLRIGVSAAKGICYAIGCPLIALETTAILAHYAAQTNTSKFVIIPMIDARRMEVYAGEFDATGKRITEDEAIILDETYFEQRRSQKLILIGDGAAKCASLAGDGVVIIDTLPHAAMMISLALNKYNEKQFEDVAYFEPHYLKAYVPGISTRSVL